jgi:peptide/nickel transport system permease protein
MTHLLRRLGAFPIVLFGASVIVFVAIRLVPGDAITAMLGSEGGLLTVQQRAALAAYFGIDRPWIVQYGRWALGLLHGDLGLSATYGKPVLGVILARFPLTLELAALSVILALLAGIPAGVLAATRQAKPADLAIRLLAMLGQSTPSFVLALLLILGLSLGFGVLPVMGDFIPLTRDPLGNLAQMLLPALVLGSAFAASVTRITRAAMLDVLGEDFVRTARSKGASPASVIWRDALPNALIPVVTLTGVELGYLLGGTVVVEQVFALPGLGRLVLDAITQRDYALVEGAVLFIASVFMGVNLLVDVLYTLLDPRVRL